MNFIHQFKIKMIEILKCHFKLQLDSNQFNLLNNHFSLLLHLSIFVNSPLHQTAPKLQFNSSFYVNVFKQTTRRLFNDCCTKTTPKSPDKLSVFGKILIGGTGAVSLALRCNRFVVSCQANRLAGSNFLFGFFSLNFLSKSTCFYNQNCIFAFRLSK